MSVHLRKLLPLDRSVSSNTVPAFVSGLVSGSNFYVQKYLSASTATTAVEANENVRPISEMPGIKSFPIIGSIIGIVGHKDFDVKRIHVFWENTIKKYGPICKFHVPGVPKSVLVTHPNDIEKVFRVTMDNPVRDSFHSLKRLRYEMADNYFEKKGGLLVENNEEWWRVRSKVQTPMMKPKNLVRYVPQMDEVTLDFMERIAVFQKEFGEMPSDFQQELYKWALESVGLVALNRRLGCLKSDLPHDSPQMQLINTVNNLFELLNVVEMNIHWWKLFPTPSFRKLKACHNLFLRIADNHIRETEVALKERSSHRQHDQREMTLLETLLQTEGLTRKDVITVILDMLFAGIDTTSHTIGFTLYLLARNRGAQKRLQEEVDSVLGDGKGPITESHLARLSFLKACVKESLRIFPIVLAGARVLQEDTVLSGYNIPKGYQIITMNHIASKDESVFPRPKEFLPERWGRDHPLGPIHPFASLPFAHGPRMCIGRRIAEQEMYIFLARVMHRFNVDYKYKDMDITLKLVFMPSEPLRFEFTERR